jgi:hypothetical protein
MSLQEPLDGENSKQHSAYLLYQNLGVGRSLTAAYNLYLDESGRRTSGKVVVSKPSPTYQAWVKDFRWEERAADWDAETSQRLRDSLLETDGAAYLAKVEQLRSEVEDASIVLMAISKTSICIGHSRLLAIRHSLPTDGEYTPMPKDILDEYSAIVRSTLDSAKILCIASDKLSEALGLARLVEGLNVENNQ